LLIAAYSLYCRGYILQGFILQGIYTAVDIIIYCMGYILQGVYTAGDIYCRENTLQGIYTAGIFTAWVYTEYTLLYRGYIYYLERLI